MTTLTTMLAMLDAAWLAPAALGLAFYLIELERRWVRARRSRGHRTSRLAGLLDGLAIALVLAASVPAARGLLAWGSESGALDSVLTLGPLAALALGACAFAIYRLRSRPERPAPPPPAAKPLMVVRTVGIDDAPAHEVYSSIRERLLAGSTLATYQRPAPRPAPPELEVATVMLRSRPRPALAPQPQSFLPPPEPPRPATGRRLVAAALATFLVAALLGALLVSGRLPEVSRLFGDAPALQSIAGALAAWDGAR